MAASHALTKNQDMLSELAFSRCHAQQSVWVVIQKCIAVSKDLREQTTWIALFHCKNRYSSADALYENGIIPHELRLAVHTRLAKSRHRCLVLKIDQLTA